MFFKLFYFVLSAIKGIPLFYYIEFIRFETGKKKIKTFRCILFDIFFYTVDIPVIGQRINYGRRGSAI